MLLVYIFIGSVMRQFVMGGSLTIYLFRWFEKKSRQDCNFFFM